MKKKTWKTYKEEQFNRLRSLKYTYSFSYVFSDSDKLEQL